MAGNYPDAPAPRMAFDCDGSVGFILSGNGTGSSTQMTAGEMSNLNDETASTVTLPGGGTYSWGIIFPQLRDVIGITHAITNGWSSQVQTSTDTTNGLDGTWTTQLASLPTPADLSAVGMRMNVQTVAWSGVKCVRVNSPTSGNRFAYWLHLYGSISTGQTPDRLRLWHPTLDEPLDDPNSADGAYFDWAEATRGTSADKTFRIKNNSGTLTANSIVVSPNLLTDTTPTVASQMTFSDGGAFTGSLNIGNLAPGAISSVITFRRTTLSNATLSLWTGRVLINPGSWT